MRILKSAKELQKQYEQEELVWKKKLDDLKKQHNAIIGKVNAEQSVKERLYYIDQAMAVAKRMARLDSLHKKWLLLKMDKIQKRIIFEEVLNCIKTRFKKGV